MPGGRDSIGDVRRFVSGLERTLTSSVTDSLMS